MLYEIGIKYTGDKEHDAQIKIPNIPISVDRRKFWFGGRSTPHWNEEASTPWAKVPVLQKGTTKIYVDDSANKDLSNIDETMIFGDDFRNETALDTNKWVYTLYCGEQLGSYSTAGDAIDLSVNNGAIFSGTGTVDTTTVNGVTVGWLGHAIRSFQYVDNVVIETKFFHNTVYINNNSDDDGFCFGCELTNDGGTVRDFFAVFHSDSDIHTCINDTNIITTDLATNEYHKFKFIKTGATIYGQVDNSALISTTANNTSAAMSVIYADVRNTDDQLYEKFEYYFIHKYLSTDPTITYIKPYHKWWLFAQQGGIIKEFFAGVFEKITHVQDNISSTQEAVTHELSNKINTQEAITQSRSSAVSNEELITQNSEGVSSANEQITQSLTVAVNSLEQIIKEYDFKASNLEQISNTKDGKASSFEAITQDNEVTINTEEKIINEYDFVASFLESIKNDITSKAGVAEENTQLKETLINTCEQMMNIFEFHASTLESVRNQIESIAGTQESISNQTTVKASTNEQMMNIYEFFGGAIEEIRNNVRSLASVEEKIANENIALASALEEIEQIVINTKPFCLTTIRRVEELKATIRRC
ncbi:hypothetical protein [Mesoaciditoga lauensis]|uniref:hypothetical protein n=1 Tax=Mesoaciditoga lauensis TaxID=1495039 RepID=UPI00056D07A4|nr:hypothetical protein [Mesoaciditoga lauensis]